VGNVKIEQCTTNTINTKRREYRICVPPLHGHLSVNVLIEFLELSQLLGASFLTFYDFQISENVSNVLKYYEGKGLAQVLSWKLSSYIGESDVHYYGQIFAMQDCLFRSMNHLDFVAFNDLDEYIVPFQYGYMGSMGSMGSMRYGFVAFTKKNITATAFRVPNLSFQGAGDKIHGQ